MTSIDSENINTSLLAFSIFKVFFTLFLIFLLYKKHRKMKELLAFRDQTYGIIAHDLKSPYVAYFRMVERIRKSIAENNKEYANEQLDHLENSFYATKSILFNMMKWSQFTDKTASANPQETDIKIFLTESTEHLISYAKLNNIELFINTDIVGRLSICQHYVSAVLRNLIDNIIKHDHCSKINIVSEIENQKLKITIQHDGEGMPSQIRRVLLKQIQTQKLINSFGNIGLGLSIITKSLKKCNGSLQITKSENGESITVYFPIF